MKPTPLPPLDGVAAREWAVGWWHGIAVGFITGVAACVFVAKWMGKL